MRDRDRLHRAFQGVDVVVHAAALKQVPAAEYNPIEAVKTNILGAQNIIDAAIDARRAARDRAQHRQGGEPDQPVRRDEALRGQAVRRRATATAARPARASPACATATSSRSRGSVIPFFLSRKSTGVLPVTHPRMTRFWITLEQGVTFVLLANRAMNGGEIFVPKIPSMKLIDLARAIAPDCRLEIVGIRPGEKLHEVMIPADESRNTFEYDTHYVIAPAFHEWSTFDFRSNGGRAVPDGFTYASDTNEHQLTVDELREMIGQPVAAAPRT